MSGPDPPGQLGLFSHIPDEMISKVTEVLATISMSMQTLSTLQARNSKGETLSAKEKNLLAQSRNMIDETEKFVSHMTGLSMADIKTMVTKARDAVDTEMLVSRSAIGTAATGSAPATAGGGRKKKKKAGARTKAVPDQGPADEAKKLTAEQKNLLATFVESRFNDDELAKLHEGFLETKKKVKAVRLENEARSKRADFEALLEDWRKQEAECHDLCRREDQEELFNTKMQALSDWTNQIIDAEGRRNLVDRDREPKLPAFFVSLDVLIEDYHCRPGPPVVGDIIVKDLLSADELDWVDVIATVGESMWARETYDKNGNKKFLPCGTYRLKDKDGKWLPKDGIEWACDECLEVNRLCWIFDGGKAIMLPLPPTERSTEDARKLGYWVKEPEELVHCFERYLVDVDDWED